MESLRTSMLIIISLVLANLLVSGSSWSAHPNDDDFIQCLTDEFERLNSTTDMIFTSSNSSYESLLRSSNLRPTSTSRKRPSVIVTPHKESEIQAAILCSRRAGIQIRVRGGGHDFEGLSYTALNPFVTVDMRNIRSVSVDVVEKTAWVQAGATLGELYHTIARQSKTLGFSGGICPTVGVGGHITGGGYGMLSRKYALASDGLIDAILINADGQILNRESMGEDLFWAIRGGGSTSFGVVVAFKIQLVAVPETVTVFDVVRTSNVTQLAYRYQEIADKFEENLLVKLYLRSVAAPNGNRTLAASFPSMYLGPVNDLLPIMRRVFPELGLVEAECTEMSWIESVLFFSGLTNQSIDILLSREPQGYFITSHNKATSDFITQPIPISALNVISKFLDEEHEYTADLQFSPFGAAMSRFSESETPFPHRAGNRFLVFYGVFWDTAGDEEQERHINWIRRLYSYMTPYVTNSPRSAYFNYKDLDLGTNNNNQGNTSYGQASVWGRKYYKNNFDRLVRVKTQVDPSNFFRNEQSIPPLTPTPIDNINLRAST